MKKMLGIILLVTSMIFLLTACSGSDEVVSQKTEEEIKEELKKELEAEMQKQELNGDVQIELETLSKEELTSKKYEYENKLNDGESQAIAKQPKQVSNTNQVSSKGVLIESKGKNYYKYKANQTIKFDIDQDGTDESITYDTKNGKLKLEGFNAIDIDTMFAETDYFIIIKFNDKFDNRLNMIGIIDYGPSNDIVTNLYSIIVPMDKKWFGHVGIVGGEIVSPSEYNEQNRDDFNYKAVIYEGQGIEAPVRLDILSNLQTWFGRNDFTYYGTYKSLLDNINIYEQDYQTFVELKVEENVIAYREKDLNSKSFTIESGQKVYLLATDNNKWIGMVAEDGTEGWVNVKDVTNNNFSGFLLFD